MAAADERVDLAVESGNDADIAVAILLSRGFQRVDAEQVVSALGIGSQSEAGGVGVSSRGEGDVLGITGLSKMQQVQLSRDHSFDGLADLWPPMDLLLVSEPGLAARDPDASRVGAVLFTHICSLDLVSLLRYRILHPALIPLHEDIFYDMCVVAAQAAPHWCATRSLVSARVS
jgi:hypothetical protein